MSIKKGQVRVLHLNRQFLPVGIVSAEHAFYKLGNERVEVVDYYQDRAMRSTKHAHKIPSIIRNRYEYNPTYTHVPLTRRNLLIRDGYKCVYCGATPGKKGLTIDHVVPSSRGGKNTWDNVVIACQDCNARKGDSLLEELDDFTLPYKPFRPGYFKWLKIAAVDIPEEWRPYLWM